MVFCATMAGLVNKIEGGFFLITKTIQLKNALHLLLR